MKHATSAFQTRLNRLAPLTADEREALSVFEQSPERRSKRDPIFPEGDGDRRIAILRSGWAVTKVRSDSGQTTIAQVFMSGDMIGLSEVGFVRGPHETTMQTDGSVSLISRSDLLTFLTAHPRLFGLLASLASVNSITLMDQLHSVARLPAEDRLMHFLLSIKSKTEQGSDQPSDRFALPLSQKEIGDVLGLTDIYVNRLLSSLQKRGEITMARPYVRITNLRYWEERLKFQNRYCGIDLNWIA